MTGDLTHKTRRKARWAHSCDDHSSVECVTIQTGDIYLQLTALPRQNEAATDHPVRMRLCAYCATKRGYNRILRPLHDSFNAQAALAEWKASQ